MVIKQLLFGKLVQYRMNRIRFLLIYMSIMILPINYSAQDIKPDGTLPVEMIYFFGSVVGNSVELKWGTATEVNNYGYYILKSDTTFDWVTIDFVQGHGNSYSPKDYVFYDTTITENGDYFYLLKQIDFDGNFELLEDTVVVTIDFITSVESDSNSTFVLQPETTTLYQNFPNPFNPSTTISFSVSKSAHITLKVYTLIGEEVTTLWDQPTTIGTYYVKFNASNLSSGIYWYQLSSNDKKITKKFILIK